MLFGLRGNQKALILTWEAGGDLQKKHSTGFIVPLSSQNAFIPHAQVQHFDQEWKPGKVSMGSSAFWIQGKPNSSDFKMENWW